jgi:hypothetical protein
MHLGSSTRYVLRTRILQTLRSVLAFTFLICASVEQASAIPAFARKYGLPCSACHEAWPKLNNFGQVFKDNGYQLGNDRDAPIFQQPSYWPIALRITPNWHRERDSALPVDQSVTGVLGVSTQGFDLSGMDILTAGTLHKNISFLLVPSADNTGAFHFESAWVRFDNLLKSSWLNLKVGKMELDNVISEKRILTLSQNGGLYQSYHYLPFVDPTQTGSLVLPLGAPGEVGVRSTAFGLGDNQLGLELAGHSRNSYTRYSAAVLSSTDGDVGLPQGRGYDTYLTFSQAFNAGSLGLQRGGVFTYFGQSPTRFFTQTTDGVANAIPGTGYGNRNFYRVGAYGLIYFKKLDFMPMFTHSGEDAHLTLGFPSDATLPAGIHDPTWNGRMLEAHYTWNPQFILLGRYDDIRISRQLFTASPTDFGNLTSFTVGYRWYPFMTSRDGFAIHNEYSRVRSVGTSSINGNETTSSIFIGFDFIF